MNCNTVFPELKAYRDQELRRFLALRIRHHLNACPDCRAELQRIDTLHAKLKNADIAAGAAPTFAPSPHAKQTRRPVLIYAGVAAGAIAALTVILPLAHPRKTLAADVGNALGKANTWRMSGWRLMGGKRVPWEVWGRRTPFLYYEKIGDNTFYDDGSTQTRSYAPTPKRPQGVRIQCASNGNQFYGMNEETSWSSVIDTRIWNSHSNFMFLTKFREDKQTASFRQQYSLMAISGINANKVFTVDKATNLPIQYHLHFSRLKQEWDTEFLSLTYNIKIPQDVQSPPRTPGYQEVDLRPSSSSERANESAVVAKIGLGLKGTPCAIDREGNIYISLTTNLSERNIESSNEGSYLAPDSPTPFHTSAAPAQMMQVECIDRHNRKSTVIYINDFFNVSPLGDVAFISPVEPLPAGVRPVHVRLPLQCSVSFDMEATDILDSGGHTTTPQKHPVTIARDKVVISVDLTDKNAAPTLTPYLQKLIAPYGVPATTEGLNRQLSSIRAMYWWGKNPADGIVPANAPITQRHGQWIQPLYEAHRKEIAAIKTRNLMRGVYWMNQSRLTYSDTLTDRIQSVGKLQTIAYWCRLAGREDLARAAWRQVLKESQRIPGSKSIRAEAEAGLAGKKLPFE